MAPMPEDRVENNLKDVIQDLYEIQSATHGYIESATQETLIQKIYQLTDSLAALPASARSLDTIIPPDIIAYVEEGRNPDIYTREFVELVQRKNASLRGKMEAFHGFAEVLEEEMKAAGIGGGIGLGPAVEAEGGKSEVQVKKEEENS